MYSTNFRDYRTKVAFDGESLVFEMKFDLYDCCSLVVSLNLLVLSVLGDLFRWTKKVLLL